MNAAHVEAALEIVHRAAELLDHLPEMGCACRPKDAYLCLPHSAYKLLEEMELKE